VLDAIRQEAQSVFIEDSIFGSTFAAAFVNRAIPEELPLGSGTGSPIDGP
jgi:hypothetical protein